ncbi:MAG: hypothetical protein ACOC3V_03175 [bacterium]
MKYLKTFEGRGISNIIKEYTDFIFSYFNGEDNKIQLDLNYMDLPLIDLKIIFKKSNKYYGYYDPIYSNLENNNLHDIIIYVEIDKNNIINHKIKGIISHELNHIKEFYEISKRMNKLNIKITPTYIKIRNVVNSLNIVEFKDFFYLIYLSYDTEMNARISQVYHYLYDLNIKDKDILFNKLKEHENWNYLELLNSFDHIQFVNKYINSIGLEGLLKITNELIDKFIDNGLNKETKLLKFINNVCNINDLYSFYGEWSKYFKIKSNKHLKKFKHLINEVIEDLNGNRPFNENYRNVLKEKDKFNL